MVKLSGKLRSKLLLLGEEPEILDCALDTVLLSALNLGNVIVNA